MGLTPLMLFITTLLIARNQRTLAAWNTRQEDNQRRAAAGLPPKTPQTPPQDPRRPRRRATLTPTATTTSPAPVTTSQDSRHNQGKARP
jgi:hypothetical protein